MEKSRAWFVEHVPNVMGNDIALILGSCVQMHNCVKSGLQIIELLTQIPRLKDLSTNPMTDILYTECDHERY